MEVPADLGLLVSVKPLPEIKLHYLLVVDIPLPWIDHHEEAGTAGVWRREGGREGGREGEREGGREGGREEGREGEREGWREEGMEGRNEVGALAK